MAESRHSSPTLLSAQRQEFAFVRLSRRLVSSTRTIAGLAVAWFVTESAWRTPLANGRRPPRVEPQPTGIFLARVSLEEAAASRRLNAMKRLYICLGSLSSVSLLLLFPFLFHNVFVYTEESLIRTLALRYHHLTFRVLSSYIPSSTPSPAEGFLHFATGATNGSLIPPQYHYLNSSIKGQHTSTPSTSHPRITHRSETTHQSQ